MTKKHFKDLAEIIRIARRWEELGKPWEVAEYEDAIIGMYKRHNPRFNVTTFKQACTPTYYKCLQCDATFPSHDQLRQHTAKEEQHVVE